MITFSAEAKPVAEVIERVEKNQWRYIQQRAYHELENHG